MRRKTVRIGSTILIPILILTVALFSIQKAQAETQPQKGISYAAWWPGKYDHPDADLALANLADTGADWISLIVTQYQDNISTTVISSTEATPTDADLIHVITKAHALGLQVMLKPHVDLENDPTHWRGQIGQGFSNTDWGNWFISYQTFINHYAQLAETYGVDQFSVGTELSTSEHRDANWRAVIAGVRGHYSGPLTYAANHGDETDISWWDAVDYIGVDAYYPLTGKNDPTVAELEAAWQPYVATLASLANTWDKPIIFTEIGYPSQDGANQHPWDRQDGTPVDLQEQADAYQAALASVFDQPWFAGMYWWMWETDLFQGGYCDGDYTPYDKPAENVLRSWYGAPTRNYDFQFPPNPNPPLEVYTDTLSADWGDWSWATVDLSSNVYVFSGTQAISVTAQGWEALSLHHASVDSTPYYWLEFYVRTAVAGQQLSALMHDEHDIPLRKRPVDDCRYIDGQSLTPGVWTRVRIPLSHLDAKARPLQRMSIQNSSEDPATFWIDEIQLVGSEYVFLPLVTRDP